MTAPAPSATYTPSATVPDDKAPAPPSALALAKAGWGAFSTVKDTVTAVTSPVRFLKDKALEFLAQALLSALKTTIGPKLAQTAVDRLNLVGKTIPLSVPVTVPASVAKRLDAELLEIAQNVANEALAGPLELLGYRLGRLSVAFDEQTRVLTVDFEAGLLPAALPPAPASAGTPSLTQSAQALPVAAAIGSEGELPPELTPWEYSAVQADGARRWVPCGDAALAGLGANGTCVVRRRR